MLVASVDIILSNKGITNACTFVVPKPPKTGFLVSKSILYSMGCVINNYIVPVCSFVKTITPRHWGPPDTLLHVVSLLKATVHEVFHSNEEVKFNYTTNRHEITVENSM